MNATRDHYISTTFLAVCLFMTFMLINQSRPNSLSTLGEKDSLLIYVLHPIWMIAIATINGKFMPYVWTDVAYPWIKPIVILLLSIATAMFIRKVRIVK